MLGKRSVVASAALPRRAVRSVAWLRAVLASAAATGAALVPRGSRGELLQMLAGAIWLGWAAALALGADRRPGLVATAGAIGDLFAAFAIQVLFPSQHALTIAAYVLAASAAGSTTRMKGRIASGAGAVVLALVGTAVRPGSLPPDGMGALLVLVIGAVAFMDRVERERIRSATRSALLESKSDAILDHVADAVVVTDRTGAVRQWNRSARVLVGCSAEEAIGRNCSDVLGLHLGERALDCSRGCRLLARGLELEEELWRSAADGRRQPLLATASPVTDDAGTLVEVVHSLRDITRLKQADEAKTIFLATTSHELKTPLTVILGFAQTLQAGVLANGQEQTALDAISRRADELARIVDRLLLTSRIEAGRIDIQLEEVELHPLLDERVQALAQVRKREVVLDVEPGIPPVMADPQALVTVVDHLVDNAVKYSPDGGAVRVTATHDPADGVVRIDVRDDGIGMDEDAVTHCFDRFWQAESIDGRRFGGTGIGLYIVRSLVEAMGGTVTAASARMRGSTFTVTLRLAANEIRDLPGEGERSMVREFMRQIGVPQERTVP